LCVCVLCTHVYLTVEDNINSPKKHDGFY